MITINFESNLTKTQKKEYHCFGRICFVFVRQFDDLFFFLKRETERERDREREVLVEYVLCLLDHENNFLRFTFELATKNRPFT